MKAIIPENKPGRRLCAKSLKQLLCLLGLLACGAGAPLFATNYYVDVRGGADGNPGTQEAPFRTTARGIRAAQAGDTVVILKVDFPIRESLVIQNKSGEAGRPITVDGQGNMFTGSDPLKPEDWTEIRPGVYRNDHLLRDLKPGAKSNAPTIQRYFMVWDGKPNRMGRSSKGHLPPLVSPELLQPGQWTYVDAEAAFYIAIEPGKKLEDYKIEPAIRQNGVGIGGTCLHWILRNINTEHVINDGFNIHGHTEDFVFENITSTECGDDGISAHEDCDIVIHGFVSRRNSTGMAHGSPDSPVTSTSDHLVLEDNYAYNLLLGNGNHVISESTISAMAADGGKGGIFLMNELPPGSERTLTVKLVDCRIPFPETQRPNTKPPFLVSPGVNLEISDSTQLAGPITRLPAK